MTWGSFSNPVVGAFGKLIRAAIMSANYVVGVSGWRIGQDGNAEFNQGVFRGAFEVDGLSNSVFSVDVVAGQPQVAFRPPDVGAKQWFPATFTVGTQTDSSWLTIQSPSLTTAGTFGPSIGLVDDPNGDLFHGRDYIELSADVLLDAISSDGNPIDIYNLVDDMRYQRGQMSANTPVVIGAAATSATLAVVFPTPFPVGVVPIMTPPNLTNTSVSSINWFGRCTNITNTGFTLRLYGPAPGGTGFTAGCQWTAFSP